MKKYLAGLVLTPLAVTACGPAPEVPTKEILRAYAIVHSGHLSRVSVTIGTNNIIKDVNINDTYSDVDPSKPDYFEITEQQLLDADSAFEKDAVITFKASSEGDCLYEFKHDPTIANSRSGWVVAKGGSEVNGTTVTKAWCLQPHTAFGGNNGKWVMGRTTQSIVIGKAHTYADNYRVDYNNYEYTIDPTKAPLYDYSKLSQKGGVAFTDGGVLDSHIGSDVKVDRWIYDAKLTRRRVWKKETEMFVNPYFRPGLLNNAGWIPNIKKVENYFIGMNVVDARKVQPGTPNDNSTNITGATLDDESEYIKLVKAALVQSIVI